MDETDHALIALLRKDARTPRSSSATALGCAPMPNRTRSAPGWAWVEGSQTCAVVASLLGEPGVAALHDTKGRWDLMVELRAASNAALSAVLERVRRVKGIAATETSLLLATCR